MSSKSYPDFFVHARWALAVLGSGLVAAGALFAGCAGEPDRAAAAACALCHPDECCVDNVCRSCDGGGSAGGAGGAGGEAGAGGSSALQCGMAICEAADGGLLHFHTIIPAYEDNWKEPSNDPIEPGLFVQEEMNLDFGSPKGVTLRTFPLDAGIQVGVKYENLPTGGSDGSTAEFNMFVGDICPEPISNVLVHEYAPLACDGGPCVAGSPTRIAFEFDRKCTGSVNSHVCGCGRYVEEPDGG
jgi:hypothetical protein